MDNSERKWFDVEGASFVKEGFVWVDSGYGLRVLVECDELDPEGRLVIDGDTTNPIRLNKPTPESEIRWFARIGMT